ncbi:MAG: tyrosine-type recombinase/integrase [Muribaculaceae bacterium]|nr:tyrosine-type recombinase/integrase [Roseburia sp.]MCM1431721.1 tyrosine-type recombinase/integrase [Muribaculaceae bacterium]MCM1491607.1 tyrosine-type recombinase/integrase [Muribaculaceae bacterium]
MNSMEVLINNYLEYCQIQKRLDGKTIKAYRIDLKQFSVHFSQTAITEITPQMLEAYVAKLHQQYKPKTVKRKIASLKALFHYSEYRDILIQNPFNKLQLHFREPVILPKIIPLHTVELFLRTIYNQRDSAKTEYQRKNALRDAAAAEVLFTTGMRISELCSLDKKDINLYDGTILIYGKGNKERRIQICNADTIQTLKEYQKIFSAEQEGCSHFFVNQAGQALTDQAVRRMIKKYSALAGIDLHITPHMFRHTFATSLLEQDVDIRYIQEMLGHSSINVTEIYTHVSIAKQRDILAAKHPRNNFEI